MPNKTTDKPAANLNHFAINVVDLDRGRRFYERVFGWRFTPWGPPGFLQIETGNSRAPGVQGAMQIRRELEPGVAMPGYECTFGVDDVAAVAQAVVANGGAVILPRTVIPTVGYLIFFRDSEGNVAGAMQYDANARVVDP